MRRYHETSSRHASGENNPHNDEKYNNTNNANPRPVSRDNSVSSSNSSVTTNSTASRALPLITSTNYHYPSKRKNPYSNNNNNNNCRVVSTPQTYFSQPSCSQVDAVVSLSDDNGPGPVNDEKRHDCTTVKTTTFLQPITALNFLYQERKRESSDPLYFLPSCKEIPWLRLHNGVHELAGPGGAGKTQLALSLCIQAAACCTRNNNNNNNSTDLSSARAVYISLKMSNLSKIAHRMRQMAQQYSCTTTNTKTTDDDTSLVLDRIWTRGCTNIDDFFDILHQLETNNQSVLPRIIILDSIADIFRHITDVPSRASMLFRVTAQLHALTNKSNTSCVSIIILNQATADFHNKPSNNHDGNWTPALGLSWSHCVHSRFRLDRCRNNEYSSLRRLTLAHSFHHAGSNDISNASILFRIGIGGCERVG